jgi:uncharacterized protein with NAD-binding domain and iron-sulfur cluster
MTSIPLDSQDAATASLLLADNVSGKQSRLTATIAFLITGIFLILLPPAKTFDKIIVAWKFSVNKKKQKRENSQGLQKTRIRSFYTVLYNYKESLLRYFMHLFFGNGNGFTADLTKSKEENTIVVILNEI